MGVECVFGFVHGGDGVPGGGIGGERGEEGVC